MFSFSVDLYDFDDFMEYIHKEPMKSQLLANLEYIRSIIPEGCKFDACLHISSEKEGLENTGPRFDFFGPLMLAKNPGYPYYSWPIIRNYFVEKEKKKHE